MNISRTLQRTLHALAQGGRIVLTRDANGDIVDACCFNHDGWVLSECTVELFRTLKRKRLIASRGGGPYRITREGLLCIRSRADNRVSSRGW